MSSSLIPHFFLVAVGRAVLAELSEGAAHPAPKLLAFVLAPRIGAQCGLTGATTLRAIDAFLDREAWVAQAEVNAVLDRLAARGDDT